MVFCVNVIALVAIGFFFFNVEWKGKLFIAGYFILSLLLPMFGDKESIGIMQALGCVARIILAVMFFIKLKADSFTS